MWALPCLLRAPGQCWPLRRAQQCLFQGRRGRCQAVTREPTQPVLCLQLGIQFPSQRQEGPVCFLSELWSFASVKTFVRFSRLVGFMGTMSFAMFSMLFVPGEGTAKSCPCIDPTAWVPQEHWPRPALKMTQVDGPAPGLPSSSERKQRPQAVSRQSSRQGLPSLEPKVPAQPLLPVSSWSRTDGGQLPLLGWAGAGVTGDLVPELAPLPAGRGWGSVGSPSPGPGPGLPRLTHAASGGARHPWA